MILDAIYSKKI